MPSSAKHFFHKNRSQASLTFHDPSPRRPPQVSPSDSPLPSPAFSPYSATSATSTTSTTSGTWNPATSTSPAPPDHLDDYRFHPSTNLDESRPVQSNIPTRSQSQRSPSAYYASHSTTHHRLSPSLVDVAPAIVEVNPDRYYSPAPSTAVPKEDRRRRIFRLGLSTKEPANHSSGGVNAPGRNLSVRRKPTAPPISTETSGRSVLQRWSALVAPSPSEGEEDDRVGVGLGSVQQGQPRANLPGPPLPDKDPITSPPPPTQQGFPLRGASLPAAAAAAAAAAAGGDSVVRQALEQPLASSNPSWGQNVPPVHEYHSRSETQHHRPQSHLPSPASATSTSGHLFLARGPSEALQSIHPDRTSRPSSQHSIAPPSPLLQQQHHGRDDPPYRLSLNNAHTTGSMGPPAHPPSQRPGSNDLGQSNQPGNLNRESSYQSYSQSSQGPNSSSGTPAQFGGQLGVNPPGGSYRGAPQSSPMAHQPSGDAGRTSPSSRSYDDMLNMDVAQVVAKYYELRKPMTDLI